MKIALVDDDPRALAQLEQYLTEQLGRETEISHYGSGEALLADWRPGAFELVVLDIYMGGATGMEVARRLRAGDGQRRGVGLIAVQIQPFRDRPGHFQHDGHAASDVALHVHGN